MIKEYEFLPLCDVLFNIISLAWYFCNIVFDIVLIYGLYKHGEYLWTICTLILVIFSLIISQCMSIRCYFKSLQYITVNKDVSVKNVQRWLIISVHVLQCGVLWRYLKLFVPVNLSYVKHEVRDLCMLRLIHAFCEAAPMLLIQLYLLVTLNGTGPKELTDLTLVSSVFSLFSVCWALASFSKNVRLQNVHRLVFTWLGVIFQLLWRLGTVGSRVSCLTLYSTLYGEWLFLVLGLHWFSMFLWLISPKNVFHGEEISRSRKTFLSMIIAFVYIFAYVNLQQVKHRQKMATFYIVMLLENCLLVAVWFTGVWPNCSPLVPLLIFTSYITGIGFMVLYYRFFHVRRLTYWSNGNSGQYCGCRGQCDCGAGSNTSTTRLANKDSLNIKDGQENVDKLLQSASINLNFHSKIPGVFNCRFSSPYANAAKRKKKKPTSFVPPPVVVLQANNKTNVGNEKVKNDVTATTTTATAAAQGAQTDTDQMIPFWKRPLPTQSNGETGMRVDIQHKLHEKKQKQLAELKMIEEEIKEGKIERPASLVESLQSIPRAKRHIESLMWGPPLPLPPSLREFSYQLLPPTNRWQRAETPEILLAPHYLDGDTWSKYNSPYRLSDEERNENSSGRESEREIRTGQQQLSTIQQGLYKSYRVASDIDSQISLPRSYTLPRQFKYCRGRRIAARPQHFLTSTNSSDGDVDSGDEGGESTPQNSPIARPRLRQFHHRTIRHETKL